MLIVSCVRCRAKAVKLLESSPLQVAMCFLVLIDAGIVVAEILLDLHAIRCESSAVIGDSIYRIYRVTYIIH